MEIHRPGSISQQFLIGRPPEKPDDTDSERGNEAGE
jgi:hypothetical protein